MAAPTTKTAKKPLMERVGRFLREVRAELRKVVWPNRKELTTYTVVVIVTVAVVSVFISLVDITFGQLLYLLRRLRG
ncbi:MAG: preprotein translocase subunit SecE [Firmicutes bacterium]|nr:preprotein translocase subunit SecE [Bacillota bacterium]